MVLCASLGTLPRFAFSREASCVQLPVLVCLRPSCCSVLQDNEQSPMSVLALAPTARAPPSPLVSARYPLFPSPLSTRSSRCLPLCVPGALAILHTAVSVRPLRSVCPRCALYSMHAPAALVPRPEKTASGGSRGPRCAARPRCWSHAPGAARASSNHHRADEHGPAAHQAASLQGYLRSHLAG